VKFEGNYAIYYAFSAYIKHCYAKTKNIFCVCL
jgi:hypothetical protein